MPPKRGPRTQGVYEIRNLRDGRVYVGSAQVIEWRWRGHRHRLRKGNHHSPRLQRAWDRDGEDAFEFRILEEISDVQWLRVIEQAWMDFLGAHTTRGGYNNAPLAGRTLGYKPTPEHIAAAAKGARSKARPYLITWADGRTEYIPNLGDFAKRHDMSATKLRAAARRQPAQLYKGLWVRLAEANFESCPPPCWRELPGMVERSRKGGQAAARVISKKFRVTHPDGRVEEVTNLEEFARRHGVRGHGLRRVARTPTLHTHKGFRVEYA